LDDVEAGFERPGVFAEPLDGPVIALTDRLDAGKQRQDHEQNKNDGEDIEARHVCLPCGPAM
jgi:hypothetical protein